MNKNLMGYLFLLLISMSIALKSKWNADYHMHSDFQFKAGQKAVASFNLNGTERILDIGCGTGRTTHYCAQRLTSGSIMGIDASADMIDFAQRAYADTTHLEFQPVSVTEMSFNQEFDFVYSMFCLHWVKEQQVALQKIAQSLKPQGRAVLYISCDCLLIQKWKTCLKRVLQVHPAWKIHFKGYNYLQPVDTWIDWCQQAGFIVCSHRMLERSKTYTRFNHWKNHLKALGVASNMNEKERDKFFQIITKELYSEYGKKEHEPFECTTLTLILELCKSIAS